MNSRPANALMLAFLVMTLLMLVGISVSSLVQRDSQALLASTSGAQSFYAAEGVTEQGLQALKDNLPGYEPNVEAQLLSNGASAELEVQSRSFDVPCTLGEDAWITLAPNESIQLPLFAQVDAEGNTEKVERFYVSFYVSDLEGQPKQVFTDVLRWKILGLKGGQTEAISEFIPLDGQKFTPENPSVFGSSIPEAVPEGYSWAKYYARQGRYYVFYPHYSIHQFLIEHDLNYLVMTNIAQGSEPHLLNLRLRSEDVEAVCEFAELQARGFQEANAVQKELDTFVRQGENLPVYDFVLYQTSGALEEE